MICFACDLQCCKVNGGQMVREAVTVIVTRLVMHDSVLQPGEVGGFRDSKRKSGEIINIRAIERQTSIP